MMELNQLQLEHIFDLAYRISHDWQVGGYTLPAHHVISDFRDPYRMSQVLPCRCNVVVGGLSCRQKVEDVGAFFLHILGPSLA